MKIHVGCGKRDFGPDWHHVDGASFPHVRSNDVTLREFEPNSASIIYASHILEYWDMEEARDVLFQWREVLMPGGKLRVAVPDFDKLILAYQSLGLTLTSLLGPLYGKMKMGEKTIHHKTVYNYETLRSLLFEVGFRSVGKYNFHNTEHAHIDDHSRSHLPHDPEAIATGNFTDKHILISLNVEARK